MDGDTFVNAVVNVLKKEEVRNNYIQMEWQQLND